MNAPQGTGSGWDWQGQVPCGGVEARFSARYLQQSELSKKTTKTGDLRCLREDSPAVPIVDTAMREIVFQHATI